MSVPTPSSSISPDAVTAQRPAHLDGAVRHHVHKAYLDLIYNNQVAQGDRDDGNKGKAIDVRFVSDPNSGLPTETACWWYDHKAKVSHIAIGDNIGAHLTGPKERLGEYATSYLVHEAAHDHWTTKDLQTIENAAAQHGIPFKLLNIFEDARIEHRARTEWKHQFNWKELEEDNGLKESNPISVIQALTWYEGDKAAVRECAMKGKVDPSMVAMAERYYDQTLQASRTEDLIPIIKELLNQKPPEPSPAIRHGQPQQGQPQPNQQSNQSQGDQSGQRPSEAQQPGQKPSEGQDQQQGQKPGEGQGQQPGQKPGEGQGQKPGEGQTQQSSQKPGEGQGPQPGQKPGEGQGQGHGQQPGQGQQLGQKPGECQEQGQPVQKPGESQGQGQGLQPGQGQHPGQKPGEAHGHQPGQKPAEGQGQGRPGQKPGEGQEQSDQQSGQSAPPGQGQASTGQGNGYIQGQPSPPQQGLPSTGQPGRWQPEGKSASSTKPGNEAQEVKAQSALTSAPTPPPAKPYQFTGSPRVEDMKMALELLSDAAKAMTAITGSKSLQDIQGELAQGSGPRKDVIEADASYQANFSSVHQIVPKSSQIEASTRQYLRQSVDHKRIQRLMAPLASAFKGRMDPFYTEGPTRRLSVPQLINGRPDIWFDKRPGGITKPVRVAMYFDLSGSMRGPDVAGKELVLVLNELTKRQKVEGHVIFHKIGGGVHHQTFKLPVPAECLLSARADGGAEGLSAAIEKTMPLAEKADIVCCYTDANINDAPMDKNKLHSRGIYTYGVYVGPGEAVDRLYQHMDYPIRGDTAEKMTQLFAAALLQRGLKKGRRA